MNYLFANLFSRSAHTGAWRRLLSGFGAILFLLIFCVGCNSYVSIESFDALKQEFEETADSLQGQNDAAKQELAMLQTKYDAAQNEINSLKSLYAGAQEELNSLKKQYETALQHIEALQNGKDALKQEINELQALYELAQLNMVRLESNYEAALLKIEELKAQIEDLQNRIPPEDSAQKLKIYIDQGHNPTKYHNAGATGNGLYEQDLTFTIGCLLANLLEKDGRFEVCLSRPTANTVLGTDNNSSLQARVKGAQEFGADYFISLHTNAFDKDSANGIEVYATQENSEAYAFGSSLLKGMVESTGLRNRGMKLNPELQVLKNATMPAVLLEMGFISNPTDAALLSQSPELFAQGIYNGILAYFNLIR